MIYSFSRRTDGPAFYWNWFKRRVRAGYALVRNPQFQQKVSRYDLSAGGDCEGFYFQSKNFAPVFDDPAFLLDLLDGWSTMWTGTVVPYGRETMPGVPSLRKVVESLQRVSDAVGAERTAWMYAPLGMVDGVYDVAHHLSAFGWLCSQLEGRVHRCNVDPLRVYQKVAANAPGWREPHQWELEAMLPEFKRMAGESGIELHACPARAAWAEFGLMLEPCITANAFAAANGRVAKPASRAARGGGIYAGCPAGCLPMRDLGVYDSCPHNCAWCYANRSPLAGHVVLDVESEMLLDVSRDGDVVSSARQRRFFLKQS